MSCTLHQAGCHSDLDMCHYTSLHLTHIHTCYSTGAAATVGTLAYGVYAYRFRGPMTTSRYLMRLRVVSQGAIVLAMVIGAALTTWRRT